MALKDLSKHFNETEEEFHKHLTNMDVVEVEELNEDDQHLHIKLHNAKRTAEEEWAQKEEEEWKHWEAEKKQRLEEKKKEEAQKVKEKVEKDRKEAWKKKRDWDRARDSVGGETKKLKRKKGKGQGK
jgi:hypothetical protein